MPLKSQRIVGRFIMVGLYLIRGRWPGQHRGFHDGSVVGLLAVTEQTTDLA